ncbi:MAG: BatD family protein [candidate division Zixibacteria bacterium]|nr:BatD family protein [candidate division Zixibacteria bacterium]
MTAGRTIILLGLLLAGTAFAKSEPDTVSSLPGIKITTSVDKAEVYIGDLITYEVAIIHDSTITLVPPPLGANLGAFDVKDYDPDKEAKLDGGRIQSTTTFVLSTFTTGDYVIPPVPIVFQMPDKSAKVMLAEAVPIKVRSLLENAGDSADIRPAKDPYEFKRNYIPYLIAGGVLLLLLAGSLIWLRLRKKAAFEEQMDRRPPWEIAYEKLALLQTSPLLIDGRYKEFYIELTEIVRGFLGRVYRVNVLDMTTEEFLSQYREMTLPDGLFTQTSELLKHADLVKFAKYVPERERADGDFEASHMIVNLVRTEEERRLQTEMRISAGNEQQPVQTGSGR